MQEMDQTGVSWAGYAQSMPFPGDIVSSGDYSVDQLPFAKFSYVFNNTPAYLQAHLLPLTQLSTDLQDPSNFPQFTWIAANEANNMEGPVNSSPGIANSLAASSQPPVQRRGRRPVCPATGVHHSKLANVE